MLESDELSTKITGYASTVQDETIQRYCGRIEERIRDAGSKEEARLIVEETCLSFEQHCLSDILKNSLQKYVTELLENYWKGQ